MFKQLNLKKLILILCVFSVAVTLLNAFYSIYRVQHDVLITNTLESNRVYAEKMAEMTDTFLDSAMSQLEYSALSLSANMAESDALDREVHRLRTQTDSFNSVVVVNAEGVIVSISPETIQVRGVRLTSERSRQSLLAKAPLITDPFVSPAGNYLTSLSYPIFSAQGEYLGYVGGTIYLNHKNILTTLLGEHSYNNGSYLYVVDRNRTLIYHPEPERVGHVVSDNDVFSAIASGESGEQGIINSQGVEMLAGYASVSLSGWGVVVQRPKASTLAVLEQHMWYFFLEALPIAILTLLSIWVSATFISKPLWTLAGVVKQFDNPSSTLQALVKIKPWYFEASQLKFAFLSTLKRAYNQIDQLNLDTQTDSMTGLLNRRGLDEAMALFSAQNRPFTVLVLDIDHFKRVNDTFGHGEGDRVITRVAQLIQAQARGRDIVCRFGGEEFLVFLADANMRQAFEVGERIRKSIASHDFNAVERVTISIGISYWGGGGESMNEVLKKADDALYQAKRKGRNRTEVHNNEASPFVCALQDEHDQYGMR